jgi:putative transcriptional regulator
MTASFHPDDALLLAYAAGSLDEATSLLIATHASFCRRCRSTIEDGESLGGALLEGLPPDPVDESALARLLDRLADEPVAAAAPAAARPLPGMPATLAPYVPRKGNCIAWGWLAPGVRQTLLLECRGSRVRLLKIAPNKPMPHHRHGGIEYTLILQGAYSDENGRYGVGDFSVADDGTAHQPIAAAEGCVCLIMSGAPLQLTGRLSRLLNPILPF